MTVNEWQAAIDRIVPALDPIAPKDEDQFCCENVLQIDRARIRRELALLFKGEA